MSPPSLLPSSNPPVKKQVKKQSKKTDSGEPFPAAIPLSSTSDPVSSEAEENSREPSVTSITLSSSHPPPNKTSEPSPTSIPLFSSGPLPNKTQEDSHEPSSTPIPLSNQLHNKTEEDSSEVTGNQQPAEPGPSTVPYWIKNKRKDPAPDNVLEDYLERPVEGFGKFILVGLGWRPGEGIGARRNLNFAKNSEEEDEFSKDVAKNSQEGDEFSKDVAKNSEKGDEFSKDVKGYAIAKSQATDPKCSSKDVSTPSLLRRTKEEIWSELPEKIIKDRYCNLSTIQLKLYEQEISTAREENESPKSSHVLQTIQYLLKLCSHPLLVIGNQLPESLTPLTSQLFPETENVISELHDLRHSPKLVALQEILEECGIGSEAASSSERIIGSGQHRVLIFAQHKAFLDVIERDLFNVHIKSLTYLRLDGSVPPERRLEIVKAFNSDPTIDALLLTTHVVGLGWNLTSADTLVFMEHDWSPMHDHRAIDRTCKLGQRKVVVHRLIMRGTLEEEVMNLQRFEESDANVDNSGMRTMNTDQLLDLIDSRRK